MPSDASARRDPRVPGEVGCRQRASAPGHQRVTVASGYSQTRPCSPTRVRATHTWTPPSMTGTRRTVWKAESGPGRHRYSTSAGAGPSKSTPRWSAWMLYRRAAAVLEDRFVTALPDHLDLEHRALAGLEWMR